MRQQVVYHCVSNTYWYTVTEERLFSALEHSALDPSMIAASHISPNGELKQTGMAIVELTLCT